MASTATARKTSTSSTWRSRIRTWCGSPRTSTASATSPGARTASSTRAMPPRAASTTCSASTRSTPRACGSPTGRSNTARRWRCRAAPSSSAARRGARPTSGFCRTAKRDESPTSPRRSATPPSRPPGSTRWASTAPATACSRAPLRICSHSTSRTRSLPSTPSRRRIEGGGAVIGGVGVGLAPVGQGAVVFSDVLNDRSFLANLAIYGSFDLTDALAFYIDRSERLSWGVGIFNTFQQGRDVRFPSVDKCGQAVAGPQGNACQVFYLQKQYGVIGLLSYPFSTFSRIEGTAPVQGVNRSLLENGILDANYVPTTLPESELAKIRGFSPNLELTGTWGWDTTRFGPAGAIGGTSLLVELGTGVLTGSGADALYGFAQTDAIQTLRVIGRSKLWLRAALGLAQGSRFGRTFYLSSFDNLRGFRFNDARLLGDGYYVSQAEFAFPLDVLVRIAFFSNITGIVGVDFGGVFQTSTAYRNYPRFGHLH